MDHKSIREVILGVVAAHAGSPSLQSGSVIREAGQRLKPDNMAESQQAILTAFYDLFRTGYLAWGYDLNNADPPFCHVTERGRRVLSTLSRDPANPDGYLAYLATKASINPIAQSYISEALDTYNGGSYKSAAVMIGAAAESLVLTVRDAIVLRSQAIGTPVPTKLQDWRVRTIHSTVEDLIAQRRKVLPVKLLESFEAYWAAFSQQIRAARNDAGHPSSIAPIDVDTVHASLLIFPDLASLAASLEAWVNGNYV
jgi:hypothetical protein